MYIKGLMLFFVSLNHVEFTTVGHVQSNLRKKKKAQFASYLCYLIIIHLFEEDLYAHSHN
jgi:hypothetical protein